MRPTGRRALGLPGRCAWAAAALLALAAVTPARGQAPEPANPPQPAGPPAPTQPADQSPGVPPPQPGEQPPPAPADGQAPPMGPAPGVPLGPERAEVTFEEGSAEGEILHVRGVTIAIGEYTLTAGQADGDMRREVVLTGSPTLTYRGQVLHGDAIRFYPTTRAFRVENLRTALTPDFLQGRLLSPLYLSGDWLSGARQGPLVGEDVDTTTCDKPDPDYHIRAGEIRVEPGKRVILRRATFYLWGTRIFTAPTIIIPLDRRPRQFRSSHLPSVGRSLDEGWFAKSAFNVLVADRVPGLLRLDLMEKKGLGLGTDLGWNLAKAAGALALYAIPVGPGGRNLSGRLDHRQSLGGGQMVNVGTDFQRNSYLSLPQTTNWNTRFGYTRATPTANTSLNLTRMATDSQGFISRSYTANLAQSLQLGRSTNLNLGADFSRYFSGGLGGFSQLTQQLATRLQADQRASNYTLQLVANRNVPIGQSSGQSFFGGVEKLPELSLTNYRFTRGLLSRLPATFLVSAGQYSEGGIVSGSSTPGKTATERVVAGFQLSDSRFRLTRSTDLNVSAGFEQYAYGNQDYAQYVVRNNTTLTQRWARRSGLNLNYTYQRNEGGTPFRFDRQGQYHALNADIGFLDDRRVQLTARVGYDFTQSSFPGLPAQPWQTLSANLLVRPVDWARLRSLFSFDPNTGRFMSVTSDLRLRGRSDFSLDLVGRYDPQRHRLGSLNGFLNLPIGPLWRVIALWQYNGYLNRFESRNLQIVRDLHCLEASLTYIDNPFGFRNERQIYFQLRIKAFPVFQRFGTGSFGQAIDTSVGEVY